MSEPVPDGPAELWFAVYTADGTLMGAAPAVNPPEWAWRDGRLCVVYGPVHVIMSHPGRFSYAMICAVSAMPQGSPFRPLWRISLTGEPGDLRAGDDMIIAGGVIALTPDDPPGDG